MTTIARLVPFESLELRAKVDADGNVFGFVNENGADVRLAVANAGGQVLKTDGTAMGAILLGDGAPTDFVSAVDASLVVASGGANNDLTFTAVVAGDAGNAFEIAIIQSVNLADPLAVNLNGSMTVISLPTDGAGAPVAATATQIKAAWDASARVADITVAVEGTGGGTVAAAALAPLTSGADAVMGTGDSIAGPGSLYVDTTGKTLHINVGTAAESTWQVFTSA